MIVYMFYKEGKVKNFGSARVGECAFFVYLIYACISIHVAYWSGISSVRH